MYIDVVSGEWVEIDLFEWRGGCIVVLTCPPIYERGIRRVHFVKNGDQLDTLLAWAGVVVHPDSEISGDDMFPSLQLWPKRNMALVTM